MSVKNFISSLFESDLDFSNVDIDDFITCVKRLHDIICREDVSGKSRRSARARRYNSILAVQMGLNDKYDEMKINELYTFSSDRTQIDICIRGKYYYVGIAGDWRPNVKVLTMLLANDNLNFTNMFDFAEVRNLESQKGMFSYYGGSDFPVDEVGFKRILRLYYTIIGAFVAHMHKVVCDVQ